MFRYGFLLLFLHSIGATTLLRGGAPLQQPCDDQDQEWKAKFPQLQHKSEGCTNANTNPNIIRKESVIYNSLENKFGKAANGGGSVSPFGLGLARTLNEAYTSGKPFADQDLKTEDTETGGRIFGVRSFSFSFSNFLLIVQLTN